APEILGTHYDIAFPGKQLKTARDLRRLPLDAEYRAAKAHMGQVYGWERPLYFGKTAEPKMTFARPDWFENVRAEVTAAHEKAAIFDASPFGKIEVEGPDAEAFLLSVCAGFVARAPGSVIYTALLNERGTFESDITVQRLAQDHYRLIVGTNAIKRDLAWLRRHQADFEVTLSDCTEAYAILGLMGPEAARIAADCGADLAGIGYFRHAMASFAGKPVRAARMSYVGEAGWEMTCDAADAPAIYAAMVAAGAVPAGLFAQSSMRIEKGFCAMGHELDSDVTPITTGLDFATRKKGGFIGAEALAEARARGEASHMI
ncbi:FAD-dependent oxidoreductase, partial [Thioclava sp. BHET1]